MVLVGTCSGLERIRFMARITCETLPGLLRAFRTASDKSCVWRPGNEATHTLHVPIFLQLRTWMAIIGYCLAYGTILAKMGRIYQIFHNPTPAKKFKVLTSTPPLHAYINSVFFIYASIDTTPICQLKVILVITYICNIQILFYKSHGA